MRKTPYAHRRKLSHAIRQQRPKPLRALLHKIRNWRVLTGRQVLDASDLHSRSPGVGEAPLMLRTGTASPIPPEAPDIIHPIAKGRFGADAMLGTVLIVLLILILIGALPTWPYSSGWGYGHPG